MTRKKDQSETEFDINALVEEVREEVGEVLTIEDTGWQDYVFSKLHDWERNKDGYPTTAGLRRVFPLVMGPLIHSLPTHVESANEDNGWKVTCLYEIRYKSNVDDTIVTIGDAADAGPDNNPVSPFSLFNTSVAITRSEGRCLRKALGLSTLVAEETVGISEESLNLSPNITPAQIMLVKNLCKKNEIDLDKFLAMGKIDDLEKVSRERGAGMIKRLNEYQQETLEIPKKIRLEK
jgi:hypothetical protein